MATHECIRCLRKTFAEADSVDPPFVLSISVCLHPDAKGGGHTWQKIAPRKFLHPAIRIPPYFFTVNDPPLISFLLFYCCVSHVILATVEGATAGKLL
jgi:hypothetical protein